MLRAHSQVLDCERCDAGSAGVRRECRIRYSLIPSDVTLVQPQHPQLGASPDEADADGVCHLASREIDSVQVLTVNRNTVYIVAGYVLPTGD